MLPQASGANNFDQANPRKALTGSSFSLSGYAPVFSICSGLNGCGRPRQSVLVVNHGWI